MPPPLVARPYTPPKQPRSLPAAKWAGVEQQPVGRVVWIDREALSANGWNPNRHASPELALLAVSVLEDGWTQPIVVRDDMTIVDGFHRWTVSAWANVHAMTDGLVPVVALNPTDESQQRLATIRHNRARGSHYVVSMADIVADLVDAGMPVEDVGARLRMEPEEVTRLLDRGQMTRRGAAADFNKGWTPQ